MESEQDREAIFNRELIDELTYVTKVISESESLEKKIYYYSAAYGLTQRTYRYSFSKEVLHMDLIFNTSYRMFLERINLIKQGDMVVSPDHLMTVMKYIEHYLEELIDKLRNKEDIYDVLENILVVAYSITGNGYYLFEKGQISLKSVEKIEEKANSNTH